MAPRYQKYHLKWPWTPRQVENLDEMLGEVFKDLEQLSSAVNTLETTSTGSTTPTVGLTGTTIIEYNECDEDTDFAVPPFVLAAQPWQVSGPDIFFPGGNVGIGGSTGPSSTLELSFGPKLSRIGIEPAAAGVAGSPLQLGSGPSGAGTNLAGGNINITAQPGTGNASGGSITFSTPVATGSGTTVQTTTGRLYILANGNVGIGGSPSAKFDVQSCVYSSVPHSNSVFNGDPNSDGANFIGWSGFWGLRTNNSGDYNVDVYNSGTPKAAFTILQNGTSIFTGPATLKGYTVATLPTGTVGMRAYVTDALGPTYLGTVVGGGAVIVPVFYNGTNWIT